MAEKLLLTTYVQSIADGGTTKTKITNKKQILIL